MNANKEKTAFDPKKQSIRVNSRPFAVKLVWIRGPIFFWSLALWRLGFARPAR
jgi:hypothetical protein